MNASVRGIVLLAAMAACFRPLATQAQTAAESQSVAHPAAPFELGREVPLRWTGAADPACAAIRSVKFAVTPAGTRYREMGSRPRPRVELSLSGPLPKSTSTAPLSLVLYDDAGRPLQSFAIPLAASDTVMRPATEFLNRIREHSRLWITPDLAALPDVTYRFHLGDQPAGEHRLQDASNAHFARGITLSFGLDALLKAPEQFHLPVLFAARWQDRAVDVAVLMGRERGSVFGHGIAGSWHGYTVAAPALTILVVDRETARPLWEWSRHGEVHFLDYREPQPAQFVPLRIVYFDGPDWVFDFRFQTVNRMAWLLEQSLDGKGTRKAFVDDVRIAGEPPQSVEHASDVSDLRVPPFDWAQLTDRQPGADATTFEREVAATRVMPESPHLALLGNIEHLTDERFSLKLDRSFLNKSVARWSLSRATEQGLAIAATEATPARVRTASYPVVADQPLTVDLPADEEGKTRLHSIRLRRTEAGEWTGTLEIVSDAQLREPYTVASGVLLNERGEPLAAAQATHTFRVYEPPYRSPEVAFNFGPLPAGQTPTRLLLGFNRETIGGHLGSTWARYMNSEPVFPVDRLLSSSDPTVWTTGLQELQTEHRRHMYRGAQPRGNHRRADLAREFAPFRPHFERLLNEGQDAEGLSRLCCLAGHSGDSAYKPRLIALLAHSEPMVRDAAAVGLGLLKDGRAVARVRELARLTDDSPSGNGNLINDARCALDVLGEPVP